MSVSLYTSEEIFRIGGQLLSLAIDGVDNKTNPVRNSVYASELYTEYIRYHFKSNLDESEKYTMIIKDLMYECALANNIAFCVTYEKILDFQTFNKKFDKRKEEIEHVIASDIHMLTKDLISLRYNLRSNAGDVYIPWKYYDLLNDIISNFTKLLANLH